MKKRQENDVAGITDRATEKADIRKTTRKTRKEIKKTNVAVAVEKHTHKKELNLLATRYLDEYISEGALEKFGECGTILKFATTVSKDKTKLHFGNFCKKRFCPMCNMRKSIKDGYAIGLIMQHLEEQGYKFAFLTLTVKNCEASELSVVLDRMNKAVKKMFERARVKGAVKGYIRKIEVTYNSHKKILKSDFKKREEYYTKLGLEVGMDNPVYDTYHPHMHFVLVLDNQYFVKHSKTYMSQAEWLKMWQESYGEEQVGLDIRKIQDNSESNAIKEIAKYSAKDSDLYNSQTSFLVFYFSLRGRRLLTFSGVASDSNKLFKSGDLDYIKEREHEERREVQKQKGEVPNLFVDLLNANWLSRMTKNQRKVQEYALRFSELPVEDFVKINGQKDIELAMELLGAADEKELIEKMKKGDEKEGEQ